MYEYGSMGFKTGALQQQPEELTHEWNWTAGDTTVQNLYNPVKNENHNPI